MKIWFTFTAILLISALFSAPVHSNENEEINHQQNPSQELVLLWQDIQTLFIQKDLRASIVRINEYLGTHSVTEDHIGLLLIKAEAHFQLMEQQKGIESLEHTLPIIKNMHNVSQRKYSHVYFSLGRLYRHQENFLTAIRHVKDGLVLEPQDIYHQIFLGELYRLLGKPDLALSHYRTIGKLPTLKEEERLVIQRKINQLRNVTEIGNKKWDVLHARLYEGVSYKILPINNFGSLINLHDICILVQSKYLFPCEVLSPIELDENIILERRRDQYSGDKIHEELLRRYPDPANRNFFVIAVTDRDIFGNDTNFVFSWQDRSWKIGVVSTYRFVAGLDDFYEMDIIPTRRLGIQFLSTIGSLHKFSRPISPNCPLAYPNDFVEFSGKSSKLCESTISQRDAILKKFGGPGRLFSPQEKKEINRVYSKYHFR